MRWACRHEEVRQAVQRLVGDIVPSDPVEAEHGADMLAWLASDVEIFVQPVLASDANDRPKPKRTFVVRAPNLPRFPAKLRKRLA